MTGGLGDVGNRGVAISMWAAGLLLVALLLAAACGGDSSVGGGGGDREDREATEEPAESETTPSRIFGRLGQGGGDDEPESMEESGKAMPFTRRDGDGDGGTEGEPEPTPEPPEEVTPAVTSTPTVAPAERRLRHADDIHKAAYSGEPEEVRELLVPGAPIYAMATVERERAPGDGWWVVVGEFRAPCLAPAFNPNPEVTVIFLEYGEECIPLQLAVQYNPNALEVVTRLLDWGLHPDSGGGDYTALHIAASFHDPEVVAVLLEHGADTEQYGDDSDFREPLHMAAWQNPNPEVTRLLLEHGADLEATDRHDNTPLHFAVRGSHLETVRLLLDYGADVNAIGGRREATPLHHADSPEIAGLLLDEGADIESRMRPPLDRGLGNTPLHSAVDNDNFAVAELLLERGAYVDAQSHSGTPLVVAAGNGSYSLAMIEMLLDWGADINAIEERYGYTALHEAAQDLDDLPDEPEAVRRAQQFLRLLLDRGADINAKKRDGDTACQIVEDDSSWISDVDQFKRILCP